VRAFLGRNQTLIKKIQILTENGIFGSLSNLEILNAQIPGYPQLELSHKSRFASKKKRHFWVVTKLPSKKTAFLGRDRNFRVDTGTFGS